MYTHIEGLHIEGGRTLTYSFNEAVSYVLTSLDLGQEILKPLVGRGEEGYVLRHRASSSGMYREEGKSANYHAFIDR